ncbi:MAG: 50S ribosomal protein L30 [bacterium]
MNEKIKITLVKSKIGVNKKHKKILETLSLSKINKTKNFNNTPQIQGVINHIGYLLKVEKI